MLAGLFLLFLAVILAIFFTSLLLRIDKALDKYLDETPKEK